MVEPDLEIAAGTERAEGGPQPLLGSRRLHQRQGDRERGCRGECDDHHRRHRAPTPQVDRGEPEEAHFHRRSIAIEAGRFPKPAVSSILKRAAKFAQESMFRRVNRLK